MNEIKCHHCHTIRSETDKVCPLCRRKPKDHSGRHPQRPTEKKIIPLVFSPIGLKATVVIKRGIGQTAFFEGRIVRDSGSHLGVQTVEGKDHSVEHFPIVSEKTNITIKPTNT